MDILERKLNKIPRTRMSLSRKFVLKSRLYFMMLEDGFGFIFERRFQLRALSFVVLFTFLFGIPFYSYASPGVNKNNLLFPIKEGLEKIELALADTEEEKAVKYEKFSERRLNEAEVISSREITEKSSEDIRQIIDEAVDLKYRANEASVIAIEEKNENIISRQEEKSNQQIKKLSNIASHVGINAEEKLVEKIATAMDIVSNIPNNNRNNFNYGHIKKSTTTTEDEIEEKESDIKKEINQESGSQWSQNKDIEERKVLTELELQLVDLKNELKNDYDEEDVKNLFNKLDRRVEEVNSSIENNSNKNINGLINSTKAITNNAKHFIKRKDSNNQNKNKKNR